MRSHTQPFIGKGHCNPNLEQGLVSWLVQLTTADISCLPCCHSSLCSSHANLELTLYLDLEQTRTASLPRQAVLELPSPLEHCCCHIGPKLTKALVLPGGLSAYHMHGKLWNHYPSIVSCYVWLSEILGRTLYSPSTWKFTFSRDLAELGNDSLRRAFLEA
jgi:hypothetical protein